MRTRTMAALMGATALILGAAAPAAGDAAAGAEGVSAEEACVKAAIDRSLESWTCLGGTLSYFDEREAKAKGEPVIVSEEIAPTEVIIPDSSGALISPMSTSDPDNYWCEQGTICHSVSTDYKSKTKGNVAWGNTNGVSGTFDVVLLTNLNGRSAQAQVKLFRDSGASLRFTNLAIECNHAGNLFGCGSKFADKGDGIVVVSSSWIGPTVQGNLLNQTGKYNNRVTGRVTPTGAPVLPMPDLVGKQFDCPSGGGVCKFL